MPNIGENVEQLELSYIDGRMQNGTATLANHLSLFYKVKYIFTIQPRNPTPRYLPKLRGKHVYIKTVLYLLIAALFNIVYN